LKPPRAFPKATAQRIAIVCLILAAFDAFSGQRTLAIVFAGIAIAISVAANVIAGRKNGKGR
jgi:hypothetical protein